jgi:Zn/Cd-binding protein ZinT
MKIKYAYLYDTQIENVFETKAQQKKNETAACSERRRAAAKKGHESRVRRFMAQ